MSFQQVPLDNFTDVFSATTELSSEAIGGQIVSVSDEFFAEAFHLLLVEPAPSLKGQFGSKGALYSGWETRRHNTAHDWCILRLGTTGTISGFDIDTSHFNGNEAPQASVEILHGSPTEEPQVNDARWTEVLPRVDLGPNSRHLFTIPDSAAVNYVKLNMYPDGGIARFRVYGHVTPVFPSDSSELFDLAHVFAGGRLEYTSDQHFGVGSNLILPGRGKNMGCGWETKRSRIKGHKDWVIIKLGVGGILEHVEIDTEHFKGNFPESCEIHALFAETDVDWKTYEDRDWTVILSRTKLGPHRQHFFQFENTEGKAYTHIKFTIYPDGGLQRIRIMGRRSSGSSSVAGSSMPLSSGVDAAVSTAQETQSAVSTSTTTTIVPVLPLTPEAFAPFGQVIQAYNDDAAAPKGTKITPANGGTARKFHKLSLLESAYSPDAGAIAGISIYRCQPLKEVAGDGTVELKVLERHQFTNQAFIPMGQGSGEGLNDPGHRYLVVVAKNGADDGPDLQNLRAFIASTAQGVVYGTGIWHQPMTVLGKAIDFACVETQIGDGSVADCEILELDGAASVLRLRIPKA